MDQDETEMDPLENDEIGEEEEEDQDEDLEQKFREIGDESNEDANEMLNESETNDELMEEASENDQIGHDDENSSHISTSPFKKPPDSVSVDGSTSAKESRERHMSVNSIDSDTRHSETDSERRQSANEELAAQYAQQLAFYR